MKSLLPSLNPSFSISEKVNLCFDIYTSISDLRLKWNFLKEIVDFDSDLANKLVVKIPFETHTMNLDESTNLDDIFEYLEIVCALNKELCSKLMEYLFILDEKKEVFLPRDLRKNCQSYLKKTLDVISFSEAYEKLNGEDDERKIALILTDVAIINEEIAKRMLWELFSKFKNSEPKRFLDSLKILKWASEDLFLVISIIGTEKILQSQTLQQFNDLLVMFIEEDSDLIYPLIIDVPESKKAIKELIISSNLESILDFLQIIENVSPDYMESVTNFNFNQERLIQLYSIGPIQTKLNFLKLIAEYEDSLIYGVFIKSHPIILKNLLLEIKEYCTLQIFYDGITFLNKIDRELSQELLITIDPKIVAEQLLVAQDELLVINTFITIAATNNSYLFYSLQSDFNDFIKWMEKFLTNIIDLEILALFLVSFQRIFNDTPELPVIITTIVKKLQREENLDDLGAFLGTIGNLEPKLLQLILNNLLSHLKLYPTDKIGYLLMTTSLYNLDTGLGLAKHLAARLSSEYDLKVLRKAFESIILANTKVAEVLVQDKSFNLHNLKKNIQKSDLLDKVLFLETILPIGKEIIDQIIKEDQFIDDFFNQCSMLSISHLTKILSNSNWLDDEMREEVSKCIMQRKFELEDFYSIIHTCSWANRQLCKKIINWTSITDLGEKLEQLDKTDPIIDKIITLLSEIDPDKAEKLIFDYLQPQY